MNAKISGYLILYGVFMILLGGVGYLSNPEKAKTALMAGGSFGALSVVWGVLWARGLCWSRFAALATTIVIIVASTGRGILGWQAVTEGQSEKLFAACLITVMLAASIAMLIGLVKSLKLRPAAVSAQANRAPEKREPPESHAQERPT